MSTIADGPTPTEQRHAQHLDALRAKIKAIRDRGSGGTVTTPTAQPPQLSPTPNTLDTNHHQLQQQMAHAFERHRQPLHGTTSPSASIAAAAGPAATPSVMIDPHTGELIRVPKGASTSTPANSGVPAPAPSVAAAAGAGSSAFSRDGISGLHHAHRFASSTLQTWKPATPRAQASSSLDDNDDTPTANAQTSINAATSHTRPAPPPAEAPIPRASSTPRRALRRMELEARLATLKAARQASQKRVVIMTHQQQQQQRSASPPAPTISTAAASPEGPLRYGDSPRRTQSPQIGADLEPYDPFGDASVLRNVEAVAARRGMIERSLQQAARTTTSATTTTPRRQQQQPQRRTHREQQQTVSVDANDTNNTSSRYADGCASGPFMMGMMLELQRPTTCFYHHTDPASPYRQRYPPPQYEGGDDGDDNASDRSHSPTRLSSSPRGGGGGGSGSGVVKPHAQPLSECLRGVPPALSSMSAPAVQASSSSGGVDRDRSSGGGVAGGPFTVNSTFGYATLSRPAVRRRDGPDAINSSSTISGRSSPRRGEGHGRDQDAEEDVDRAGYGEGIIQRNNDRNDGGGDQYDDLSGRQQYHEHISRLTAYLHESSPHRYVDACGTDRAATVALALRNASAQYSAAGGNNNPNSSPLRELKRPIDASSSASLSLPSFGKSDRDGEQGLLRRRQQAASKAARLLGGGGSTASGTSPRPTSTSTPRYLQPTQSSIAAITPKITTAAAAKSKGVVGGGSNTSGAASAVDDKDDAEALLEATAGVDLPSVSTLSNVLPEQIPAGVSHAGPSSEPSEPSESLPQATARDESEQANAVTEGGALSATDSVPARALSVEMSPQQRHQRTTSPTVQDQDPAAAPSKPRAGSVRDMAARFSGGSSNNENAADPQQPLITTTPTNAPANATATPPSHALAADEEAGAATDVEGRPPLGVSTPPHPSRAPTPARATTPVATTSPAAAEGADESHSFSDVDAAITGSGGGPRGAGGTLRSLAMAEARVDVLQHQLEKQRAAAAEMAGRMAAAEDAHAKAAVAKDRELWQARQELAAALAEAADRVDTTAADDERAELAAAHQRQLAYNQRQHEKALQAQADALTASHERAAAAVAETTASKGQRLLSQREWLTGTIAMMIAQDDLREAFQRWAQRATVRVRAAQQAAAVDEKAAAIAAALDGAEEDHRLATATATKAVTDRERKAAEARVAEVQREADTRRLRDVAEVRAEHDVQLREVKAALEDAKAEVAAQAALAAGHQQAREVADRSAEEATSIADEAQARCRQLHEENEALQQQLHQLQQQLQLEAAARARQHTTVAAPPRGGADARPSLAHLADESQWSPDHRGGGVVDRHTERARGAQDHHHHHHADESPSPPPLHDRDASPDDPAVREAVLKHMVASERRHCTHLTRALREHQGLLRESSDHYAELLSHAELWYQQLYFLKELCRIWGLEVPAALATDPTTVVALEAERQRLLYQLSQEEKEVLKLGIAPPPGPAPLLPPASDSTAHKTAQVPPREARSPPSAAPTVASTAGALGAGPETRHGPRGGGGGGVATSGGSSGGNNRRSIGDEAAAATASFLRSSGSRAAAPLTHARPTPSTIPIPTQAAATATIGAAAAAAATSASTKQPPAVDVDMSERPADPRSPTQATGGSETITGPSSPAPLNPHTRETLAAEAASTSEKEQDHTNNHSMKTADNDDDAWRRVVSPSADRSLSPLLRDARERAAQTATTSGGSAGDVGGGGAATGAPAQPPPALVKLTAATAIPATAATSTPGLSNVTAPPHNNNDNNNNKGRSVADLVRRLSGAGGGGGGPSTADASEGVTTGPGLSVAERARRLSAPQGTTGANAIAPSGSDNKNNKDSFPPPPTAPLTAPPLAAGCEVEEGEGTGIGGNTRRSSGSTAHTTPNAGPSVSTPAASRTQSSRRSPVQLPTLTNVASQPAATGTTAAAAPPPLPPTSAASGPSAGAPAAGTSLADTSSTSTTNSALVTSPLTARNLMALGEELSARGRSGSRKSGGPQPPQDQHADSATGAPPQTINPGNGAPGEGNHAVMEAAQDEDPQDDADYYRHYKSSGGAGGGDPSDALDDDDDDDLVDDLLLGGDAPVRPYHHPYA